jgi:hypothetical protein
LRTCGATIGGIEMWIELATLATVTLVFTAEMIWIVRA